MTRATVVEEVQVDLIDVLNPRERSQKTFAEIVASIKALGLKKPITVTPRKSGRFALVCGQGRLEAFRILGQSKIPAFVVNADDDEAYVMSLVENIARRTQRPYEILDTIRILQEKGYSVAKIAAKTALDENYVRNTLTLLNKGEERLINAVETGRIPLMIALEISRCKNGDEQQVLQEAYESGKLRGRRLLAVRKLIERRRAFGIGFRKNIKADSQPKLSSSALVRAYNQEVEKQKELIRKADLVQQRLAFIGAAIAQMMNDENFVNVLRAEGLDTLPKPLEFKINESRI